MNGDLSRWIEAHSRFTPNKPAIRFAGQDIAYSALAARIRSTAAILSTEAGIDHGDRVAYLGFNTPDMLILLFACARLGAILLPLNWRLAPPEQAEILNDATPAMLVADPAHADQAKALIKGRPDCHLLEFDNISATPASPLSAAAGTAKDPLLLVYTSGTTGRAKGAILTQQAILCNALNSIHMHDMVSADHVLTVLPMFHVGGLNIHTMPALYSGATVTLHRSFDPGATLAALAADRPSLLVLVPATITALHAHPGWLDTDISSLRALTTGSTIVPLSTLRIFHERDIPVIQVYGLTESGPVAAYQRIDDALATAGSTGRAALHTDVRVVDNLDRDVPPGQSGEILLRGANLLTEYWRDPVATAEAFCDGWFHTGDIGQCDGAGNIVLKDRKKDMVISGGENVYPAEIEQVLEQIEGIAEAAVIGRIDDRWGEVPVAIVVRTTAKLTKPDILAAFHGRLARFKHPKDIIFVEALPRNALGKIQKQMLRGQFDAVIRDQHPSTQ